MAVSGSSDPVNFIPAESFFNQATNFKSPKSVSSATSSNSTDKSDPLRYAVELRFDDGTIALIQFVRPTVWRVRYDPTVTALSGYSDANTLSSPTTIYIAGQD